MINGEMRDFIEGLNIGKEMAIVFRGERFLIQGWRKNDHARITVDSLDKPHDNEYLWSFCADSMSQCADAFLEARLWDDKVFGDAEEEVRWTDNW